LLAVLVGLASICASGAALAMIQAPTPDKETSEKARAHYETGLHYYDVADYQQAIREFKRAYELSAAPELLFNIGQAHRLAGDCADGAAALQELPARGAGGPQPARRK
jgi:tetratricopeptide (TPR) repeat protein